MPRSLSLGAAIVLSIAAAAARSGRTFSEQAAAHSCQAAGACLAITRTLPPTTT